MDINVFRGLVTAVVMLLFIGICVRSFSRKRTAEFHEAELLPLEDDSRPPAAADRPRAAQQSTRDASHE
tara:strand:- start:528 stop:734 length:207 start_codon:yes stop_codon:yes gene_type:complete